MLYKVSMLRDRCCSRLSLYGDPTLRLSPPQQPQPRHTARSRMLDGRCCGCPHLERQWQHLREARAIVLHGHYCGDAPLITRHRDICI